MYNEEVKKQFIETQPESNERNIKQQFEYLEQLEEKYDLDLSCIPKDVIAIEIMDKMNIGSIMTLRSRVSIITRYQKFANEKGIVPEEYKGLAFEKIDYKDIFLENNKTKIFRTPTELKEFIEKIIKLKTDRGITTDQLVAAYISLLYSGLKDEEIFNLTTDDVKLTKENVAVISNEKVVILNEELDCYVRDIVECRVFMVLAKKGYGERKMDKRLLDNGGGWSDANLKKITKQKTRERLGKINIKTENLYIMGMIYKHKAYKMDKKEKDEFLKICWGNNVNQAQRENTNSLIRLW